LIRVTVAAFNYIIPFGFPNWITEKKFAFRDCGRNLAPVDFVILRKKKIKFAQSVTWWPGSVAWWPGDLVTWWPGGLVTWWPGSVAWWPGDLVTWWPGDLGRWPGGLVTW